MQTKKITTAVFFFAIFFIFPALASANPIGNVNVNLIIPGCNNNGVCEPSIGENSINCSNDCPIIPSSTPTTTNISPVVSGGGSGSYFPNLSITNISISTAEQSANIDLSTNDQSLTTFAWGLTTDYEIGSVSDVNFSTVHEMDASDLSPGTHYYFEIEARDLLGRTVTYSGDFYTLSLPNLINVPNVRDLNISPQENALSLTWVNPPVANFAGVVVVRSPYGYPSDVNDGKIIYEGPNNSVVDSDVKTGATYYYSVFVFDQNKNYSSGTVGSATFGAANSVTQTQNQIPPVATSTEPVIELKLTDIDFIQGGKSITNTDGLVPVVSDSNLTVSISRSKLPADLDVGSIKVTDPSNVSNTYLFVFNKARNAYEAEVNVYGSESGIYPFTIDLELANYERAVLTAEFTLIKPYKAASSRPWFWPISQTTFLVIICLFILLLLLIFLVFRRRKSKK